MSRRQANEPGVAADVHHASASHAVNFFSLCSNRVRQAAQALWGVLSAARYGGGQSLRVSCAGAASSNA